MEKVFNYENKIYGERENCSLMFSDLAFNRLPNEVKEIKGKILDIGCGAGEFTEIIKMNNMGSRIYGTDISAEAINICRKNFKDITFKKASVYKLPFGDNFFNFVVMRCVLEHLDTPGPALKEVFRVLKPGGVFYSITPLEKDKSLVFAPKSSDTKKYHGHVQWYSKEALFKLITKEKLAIKKYYFSGYLLRQFLEVVFYPILTFFHLPVHFSVKSYVGKKSGLLSTVLSCIRKIVNLLLNMETLVVPKKIPGLFVHIIAYKEAVVNDKLKSN